MKTIAEDVVSDKSTSAKDSLLIILILNKKLRYVKFRYVKIYHFQNFAGDIIESFEMFSIFKRMLLRRYRNELIF